MRHNVGLRRFNFKGKIMNSINSAPSSSTADRAWRIEMPTAARPVMAFFPDQNGGVYEKLLNNLPVMLHTMDGSGRMISANAVWCASLGYEARDIIGRSFAEFLPLDARTRLVTEIYPKFLVSSSIRDVEIQMHRKDGSLAVMRLAMTAYRGDKGRLEQSVCVLEDISDKKIQQVANSVGKADPRLRAAFAAAAHGLAVISTTGMIELANTAMCTLLERDDLEGSNVPFEGFVQLEDRTRFLAGVRDLLNGTVPILKLDLRLHTSRGRVVPCSISVALMKNDKGEPEQLILQTADITERRQSQARLQRAQKMEAIGQLTGGLAHDFNNLLTVIIGNLQLIDGKFAGDEKSARRVSEAIDAARKGSDLTRQLLAVARKQELAPAAVHVNALVQGMEPLLVRSIGEQIDLKVVTMAGDPVAMIDASQLESALLNLTINARDAMEKGGKLTIETSAVMLDKAYADKNVEVTPGPYVMIAVTDTGEGMRPEVQEKVFQPFYTTKPQGKGTGLGLSMVYGFIKQSGGHISIYSEVGHGTSVKMFLPRKMVTAEAGVVAVADTAAVVLADEPKRKAKILVVEDQEAVRAVACGFLEDFGYEIVEAGDGFQALAVLQEQQDIDLMFSDVVMPGGMNGFDLAQAALTLRPTLKVVHTSGYPKGAMVHQEEPRFKQGFIIMKPYRRDELKQILESALEKQ